MLKMRHTVAAALPGARCALILSLCVAAASPAAHGQLVQKWAQSYQGGPILNRSRAVAVAVDAAGDIFVTGPSENTTGNVDYVTVKYQGDTGVQIWEARYDGEAHGDDVPHDVKLDSQGDVIVTGSVTISPGDTDVYTVKYSGANGLVLWERFYDGSGHGLDAGHSVAVDSQGNVAVAGYARNASDNQDYYVALYAATNGAVLWEDTFDGPEHLWDVASAVAVDAAGNVIVTGGSQGAYSGPHDNYDFLTIKYAPLGTRLWTRRTGGASGGTDVALALAVDAAGDVIVTGESYDLDVFAYDFLTVKYSGASGVPVWSRMYASPVGGDDIPAALAVDGAGDAVVVGMVQGAYNGNSDFYVVKYAGVDGALLWDASYDGPFGGADAACGVALDQAGNAFVTGVASVLHGLSLNLDFCTRAYDADTGTLLWSRLYNGPDNLADDMETLFMGAKIATTPDGGVVIAGHSFTYSYVYSAFKTVKYGIPVPEIEVASPSWTVLVDGVSLLDSGSVVLGNDGPVQTITVRNVGDADLTGIAVSLAASLVGANAADFVGDFSGVTATLAPGASFTFSVTFHPSSVGVKTAAVHIASSDADENPFDVALQGTGIVVPEIVVEDPAGNDVVNAAGWFDFGARVSGSSGPAATFTIRNTGTADLHLGVLTLGGDNHGEFDLDQSGTLVTVPPGADTAFTLAFHPLFDGWKNALVSIPNDDPDEAPFEFWVYGFGGVIALTYEDWAAAAGLVWPDSAPDAAPFGDGVPNLLKYAFNMDGSGPDSQTLVPGTGTAGLPYWSFIAGEGTLTMRVEFLRRKGAAMIYAPVVSPCLDPFLSIPVSGEPFVSDVDAEWERVVVEEVCDLLAQPQNFARVEVASGGE